MAKYPRVPVVRNTGILLFLIFQPQPMQYLMDQESEAHTGGIDPDVDEAGAPGFGEDLDGLVYARGV